MDIPALLAARGRTGKISSAALFGGINYGNMPESMTQNADGSRAACLISASSPLVTTMPAPCCTETGSQPAKCGFGSTFSSIEWLSSSLVITLSGKKVALELEPT